MELLQQLGFRSVAVTRRGLMAESMATAISAKGL
jgi:hypothetical protein